MRVSIFNCVSAAYEMLRFSSDHVMRHAGTDNFDYIVVTWLPTPDVERYLLKLALEYPGRVHVVRHEETPGLAYVPQLRAMMNTGFTKCFELNEFGGMVNTDMYFGKDWLVNLVKYADEGCIANSLHITPTPIPWHVNAHFGIPEYGKFNYEAFDQMYEELYDDSLVWEEEKPTWRHVNTMPYIFHRKWWEKAGPWELNQGSPNTPDVRFFQRCHDAGARFCLSRSSIVYHLEGGERTAQHKEKSQPGLRPGTPYAR